LSKELPAGALRPAELGRLIRNRRLDCGLTQDQLAGVVGLSGETIRRWEAGENLEGTSSYLALALFLGFALRKRPNFRTAALLPPD
jgi:transcriptional regulator with XRE-family HTH domain